MRQFTCRCKQVFDEVFSHMRDVAEAPKLILVRAFYYFDDQQFLSYIFQ